MVRYYVQTASFFKELRNDFHGSMEKIAAAGYAGVELFDGIYGGYSPAGLQEYLESLHMTIISAHVAAERTLEQLEYLSQTSCKYIVCPGLHIGSAEDARKAARQFNEFGGSARNHGLKYGYHNHNNDFDMFDGKTVIEILISETDPELVTFELDAAWAWRSGINAAEFINRHKGRFELIHLKETSRKLEPEENFANLMKRFDIKRGDDGLLIMTEEARACFDQIIKVNCSMGAGLINPPELIPTALSQGTQGFIVEREYAYTGEIFSSLAEDISYLNGLNL